MNTTDVVRIAAHQRTVKQVGHWTEAREFEVRSHRGATVLDLRSARIPEGDIHIKVDLDHAMLKLLLPDDAEVVDWDLRRSGRSKVKDGAAPDRATGRRTVITGEMRQSEIRVNRGGVAVLSAMLSREFIADARRAHREGRTPDVADPGNHP